MQSEKRIYIGNYWQCFTKFLKQIYYLYSPLLPFVNKFTDVLFLKSHFFLGKSKIFDKSYQYVVMNLIKLIFLAIFSHFVSDFSVGQTSLPPLSANVSFCLTLPPPFVSQFQHFPHPLPPFGRWHSLWTAPDRRVSRGRVCGCGRWPAWWLVTCDISQVTCDMWQNTCVIHNLWQRIFLLAFISWYDFGATICTHREIQCFL